MYELLDYANQNELSVYFFGAKPEVNKDLLRVVKIKYENIKVVGSQHGYIENYDMVAHEIKEKKPDLVFVGLGIPIQEMWIRKYIDEIEFGVFMGLGGSFDVLSGHTKRAPDFWIKMNIEWLYRILTKPKHMKKLYFIHKFVLKVIKTAKM